MAVKTNPPARRSNGPGRRAAKDPKVRVMFYVETSIINAAGGMEEARERCIDFLSKVQAAQTLNEFLHPTKNGTKSTARKIPRNGRTV